MKEGYEVYEAYLKGHEEDIEQGKELILEVKDYDDFVRMVVKAKVAKSLDALPGAKPLWVRDYAEDIVKHTEPWGIQIIEELDEDEVEAKRFDEDLAGKKGAQNR